MSEDRFGVNLYFSGSVERTVNEYLIDNDAHRLATFAYPKEASEYLNLANEKGKKVNMIVDSGAFTSWSVGKPVRMSDLVTYNENLIKTYGPQGHNFLFISLDVIPGERGRRATSDEISKAVVESYENFKILQQHFRGHYVLPVYHSGEDVGLRNAYLNLTDYVCLSMDQGMAEKNRLEWAKRAASVPQAKFHGLAATGNRMVSQVGWYSVDSSSWITVGAMGGLLWPNGRGGFRVLPVSEDSPTRHEAGQHLRTLAPVERAAVEATIIEAGFNPDELAKNYTARRIWNVNQWLNTPWRTQVDPVTDLWST